MNVRSGRTFLAAMLLCGAPVALAQSIDVTIDVAIDDAPICDEAAIAALRDVVADGDASRHRSTGPLVKGVAEAARCSRDMHRDMRSTLFQGVRELTWDPSHDTALLATLPGSGVPILRSNATLRNGYEGGAVIAVGGTRPGRHTLALGSSPFRTWRRSGSMDPGMERFTRNAVAWLANGTDSEDLKVVTTGLSESYYFPDRAATRAWFEDRWPGTVDINDAEACDGVALATCLAEKPDLVIVSTGVTPAELALLEDAADDGVGLLYLHKDGHAVEHTAATLALFGAQFVQDGYWPYVTLDRVDPRDGSKPSESDALALRDLARSLAKGTSAVDFSACTDDDGCPAASEARALMDRLDRLRGALGTFDRAGLPLFDQDGHELLKALVLLGDRIRADVSYPIDRSRSLDMTAALFADSTSIGLRRRSLPALDLGNHGRPSLSVVAARASVDLTSRSDYRSAGVYALPGQTFTVTRTDDQDVGTHVRINLVRASATHPFDPDGYTRPMHASSRDLPIAPGQTLSITSVHGGPVFIRFDENDLQTRFEFDGVGRHPVWRSADDDAAFTLAVDAGDYDWAEILTDGFEVHSRLDKMRETLQRGQSPARIAALSARNFTDHAHALAGFVGRGITERDDIHGWARREGLGLHEIDTVKHMNADQATCGYGCSGNPYDAYWAFDPVGHGDLHELGHGLERPRMQFDGQERHTITNPYSYFAKANYLLEGGETDCQSLPFETLYDRAVAAQNTSDPGQSMRAHDHGSWSYGVAVNLQTWANASRIGATADRWSMLGRLHVLEREFSSAIGSDGEWAEKHELLGFSGWSRGDARALGNNDVMLVLASRAIGRDMRAWYELWGHEFGDRASSHVARAGYEAFPLTWYKAGPEGACRGLGETVLNLSADGVWD